MMKIKNILPLLLFLVSCSFYAQSEAMESKKEKIKAYKISFLTTELDLSATQAEKFWPLYTAFDNKQFELRHQKMKVCTNKLKDQNISSISEKEAVEILNQFESTDDQLYSLRKKYMANLKKILPAKKIVLLKKSEDEFNRKLLHQYRDKASKN
ncbi:sensor of ECF-type sigma factor [Flavobacterium sp. TAB 87]|uniref:sensor of ECF-type sigma factor n=1 Tax=Flavobacterium sp. TAB 87 TaxID=1729581 RepID=UPI00268EFB7C